MREIGGYFELENFISNEYYSDLIALNTARSALIYIMKAKKIKKIYIPYFLCNVIREILIKYNYEFEYYNIDKNFRPIFSKILKENEYIYIVNYYGQLKEDDIKGFKKIYNRIILDNTQAFFQKPIYDIDTIYTCRKYFGVPDGAYLSTKTKLKEDFEFDKSMHRMEHLLGRFENCASDFYNRFIDIDEMFKEEPIKNMSKLTHNILGAIDYEKIKYKREKNFSYLYKKFRNYNLLNLRNVEGPFMYPLLVKDGDFIRKKLAKMGIYIPTLWPNVINESSINSIEYEYSMNILPLPCDQRYSIEDMEYLVEMVKRFLD